MDKHEMTAKEFVDTAERMCDSYKYCDICPLCKKNCPIPRLADEDYIAEVKEWAEAHPAPRKTVLVPDEIVNELTFEATYVDKRGVELTPEAKKMRMELYAELVRKALPNADSVRCVKIQQFVTRGHEEEAE